MDGPTFILAASLLHAGGSPPVSLEALEAECQQMAMAGKHVEAADACRRAFEAVPDQADAFDRRSFLAFDAHNHYQRAHELTGDAELLCADARMLKIFLDQLATLPPGERPEDRHDAAEALRKAEAGCPDKAPAEVEELPSMAPEPPEPAAATEQQAPAPAQPRPDVNEPRRERRPLHIGGASTLALGIGFGVAMAGALIDAAVMQSRADALSEHYRGQTIAPEEAAHFAEVVRRGELDNRLAPGFGAAAGALSIAGAALLLVDARRHARPSRVALQPAIFQGAGIRVKVSF